MFGLTALELARIQFGFTISFHIISPRSPSGYRGRDMGLSRRRRPADWRPRDLFWQIMSE
jgi:cytochrome d ubiquinol oxidase subunit I